MLKVQVTVYNQWILHCCLTVRHSNLLQIEPHKTIVNAGCSPGHPMASQYSYLLMISNNQPHVLAAHLLRQPACAALSVELFGLAQEFITIRV